MIERVLQVKKEQHKQEIDEPLGKRREEKNQKYKQQMDAMTAAITAQMAAQAAAYEDCFRTLEGYKVVPCTSHHLIICR
ncbi:hypothetical protein FH972_017685 [Carpinus fangiana]|uniref:Uncharacterized protein n=1 Tax=Carpinus fangiana TaxID=176857 RepID=A0A5N6RK66_9ROSI|nr:hypothetical protein FH972_017685 [Carpinus fangiana]